MHYIEINADLETTRLNLIRDGRGDVSLGKLEKGRSSTCYTQTTGVQKMNRKMKVKMNIQVLLRIIFTQTYCYELSIYKILSTEIY